jgi:PKD repeat protein
MSSRPVGSYTHSLFFQPGTTSGDLPKEVFNTIRIPIADFTGVNLTKIRHIKFKFNQSTAGAILVSDLALNYGACGGLNANFTHTVVTGLSVSFTNTTESASGDTVSYLWHFGNPASGTSDTSTLQNPGTHLYTASGYYTACLYVTSHRRNGMVCTDTFCTSVVVGTALEAQNQQLPQITIIPNPAKDYLQVNGAESTDILRLTNLYGQEVFTSPVSHSYIRLPETLAAGIYYAVVVTAKGNVYQKVIITR